MNFEPLKLKTKEETAKTEQSPVKRVSVIEAQEQNEITREPNMNMTVDTNTELTAANNNDLSASNDSEIAVGNSESDNIDAAVSNAAEETSQNTAPNRNLGKVEDAEISNDNTSTLTDVQESQKIIQTKVDNNETDINEDDEDDNDEDDEITQEKLFVMIEEMREEIYEYLPVYQNLILNVALNAIKGSTNFENKEDPFAAIKENSKVLEDVIKLYDLCKKAANLHYESDDVSNSLESQLQGEEIDSISKKLKKLTKALKSKSKEQRKIIKFIQGLNTNIGVVNEKVESMSSHKEDENNDDVEFTV